jgi:hypothetical protein
VSGQCANAHLPSIGGDLVPENTAFVQVLDLDLHVDLDSSTSIDLHVLEYCIFLKT